MFVLGIHGSPCKNGNSELLLGSFLSESERRGAQIHQIRVAEKAIHPCIGCGYCGEKGMCRFADDMNEIYALLRQADLIVIATPVYFYNVPAQLKALIDRAQALWSRKYILKLRDPGDAWRQGFLLGVGATKGENLFTGVALTAHYFFDAVGARLKGSLTFRKIDKPGEIREHPTALRDAEVQASALLEPLAKRKKVLFVCRENRCRSQMAAAFAQHYGGDGIEAQSAGNMPADAIDPVMAEAMAEKSIDMAFRKPKSTEAVVSSWTPDMVVSMGCDVGCPFFPEVETDDWGLPDPVGKPISFMRMVRDEIEKKVRRLVKPV